MYRLLLKGGRSVYPSRDKEKMRPTPASAGAR